MAMLVVTLTPAALQAQQGKAPLDRPNVPARALLQFKPAEPSNAALLYYRYFIQMDMLPPAATDPIGPEGGLKPEAGDALDRAQGVAEGLMRAASLKRCDFGVEYSQGYAAVLPHLAKVRGAARMLTGDAQRLGEANESAAAADRLVAAINMGRHLGNDRTLVSSLTGMAVVGQAQWAIEAVGPTLNAEDAARVVEVIESIDRDSPFGVREAAVAEAWFLEPLRQRVLTNEAPGKELVRIAVNEYGFDAKDIAHLVQYGPVEMDAMFDDARSALVALDAAWDAADPEGESRRIAARIKDGEFGAFAQVTVPSMHAVIRARDKMVEQLDETLAILRPMAKAAD